MTEEAEVLAFISDDLTGLSLPIYLKQLGEIVNFSSRIARPERLKNAPPVSRDHRSGG